MSPRAESRKRSGAAPYWTIAGLLIVVGFLSILTIGMAFLLLGLTLAVVSPWRTRTTVLFPAVAAVLGFLAGYLLTAPLSCSVSVGPGLTHPHGSCTTVIGLFHYDANSPSLVPPLIVGLVTAATAGAITHRLVRHDSQKVAKAAGV